MMLSFLRQRIKNVLADRLRVPSVDASLKRLSACGFTPEGVFDVGAYKGDFAELALQIWPKTHVSCFEPQKNRMSDLSQLSRQFPDQVSIHNCLLGEAKMDEIDFHVGGTASSVLAHSSDEQYPAVKLPMTTLDHWRNLNEGSLCTLLKLDVQGYELNVLRGAENTIRAETQVILAELNLLEIYKGASLISETFEWLSERGFIPYDIGGLIRRPLDDALWQVDFLFTRKESPLRENKSWA